MVNVHKEYRQAFVLEATKLNRLLDKIHERLGELQDATPSHDSFEVFLTDNRRAELTTLTQVLESDNSRKSRITRLVVTCSASSVTSARAEHEVQVDFARPQQKGAGGSEKVVSVSVRSNTPGWATRTLSEVEEQVERNWTHHARPVVVLVGGLVVTLLLLASPFLAFRAPLASDLWLTPSDMDRIAVMLAQRPALTDDELREISTMQVKNLIAYNRPTRSVQEAPTRTLFTAVPLAVVGVCIVVLLTTCYPSAVFLWGDEVGRYDRTVQRRRTMWHVIVGVTVIGMSSRLLFDNFSTWFPR